MSATMERDFLGDASGFQPVLQGCLGKFVTETCEDDASTSLSNQLQCLVTDGVVHQFLCFLHTECHVHASVTVWLYVLPCELFDVALSQSRQTSKEESGLQDGIFARRVRQPYKLVLGQVLLFSWDCVNAFQKAIGILHDLVFPIGCMEYGTEG